MKNNKPRKYYRKCGECGTRLEQSEMIRTDLSDNGWLCPICYYGATYYEDPYTQLDDSAFDYEW